MIMSVLLERVQAALPNNRRSRTRRICWCCVVCRGDVEGDPDSVEGDSGKAPAREADGVEPRLAFPPLPAEEEVAALHTKIHTFFLFINCYTLIEL